MRILFVGGDLARKGGHDLLEACGDLLPGHCELHIVTRAPLESRPGLMVYRNIEPNSPELRRLYAEADLFVLPTYADGLPMVLMEAAAAGLPVISTPVGAIAEAVEEGRTGLLVPPGDIGALRATITALLDAPERRHAMGQAARRMARARFDARANALALRDLLLDAVIAWPDRPRIGS